MTTHPIDTFELREDLAALRKLDADAAEAVALRAENARLREALREIRSYVQSSIPRSAATLCVTIKGMAHEALEAPHV